MTRLGVRTGLALAAALAILQPGCRRAPAQNDQVEGTVKLDNKPLANVMIQFVPDLNAKEQAPQSTAMTDENGHYKLVCDNRKPGAVVGKHNVVVLVGRGDRNVDLGGGPDAAPARGASPAPSVPDFYTIASKTPLQVEVTADRHTYDLDLSVNAKPR